MLYYTNFMSRESCLQHAKGSRMVLLREDFLHLLDGDLCAAAVLGLFEYLTNGEIARMSLAEQDGEPWVRASNVAIQFELLEIYQARTVQGAVRRLVDYGLVIEHQDRPGRVKQYLLDVERIQALLQQRVTIASLTPAKIADDLTESHAESPAKIADDFAGDGGDLNLKVLSRENRVENPPVAPFKETNKKQNPADADKAIAVDLGEDVDVGEDNGPRARESRGPRDHGPDPDGPRKRWPKRPARERKKGLSAQLAETFREEGIAGPLTGQDCAEPYRENSKRRVIAPDAATGTETAVACVSAQLAQTWNQLVPIAAFEFYPQIDEKKVRNSLKLHPGAVEKFEEICRLAAEIHAARGEDADWLTFRWLWGEKDGAPNWWRLLEELRWMRKQSGKTKGAESAMSLTDRVRAKLQAQIAKEKANATDPGKS